MGCLGRKKKRSPSPSSDSGDTDFGDLTDYEDPECIPDVTFYAALDEDSDIVEESLTAAVVFKGVPDRLLDRLDENTNISNCVNDDSGNIENERSQSQVESDSNILARDDNVDPIYPFKNVDVPRLQRVWFALGDEKWREVVDGRHARYGANVYDECLHGANFGQPEEGFLSSMKAAWEYIGRECLGRPTTADMWMKVHSLAMQHWPDSRIPGKYRRDWERNMVVVPGKWPGKPGGLDATTWSEISELRPMVCSLQPSDTDPNGHHLVFLAMKRKRRRRYLSHFIRRYYASVKEEVAKLGGNNDSSKDDNDNDNNNDNNNDANNNDNNGDDEMKPLPSVIEACIIHAVQLQQSMQRMEPAKDGNQRVSVLFLNKHLVELGLSSTILWWPNGADILSKKEWAGHVVQGMIAWRRAAERIAHGKPLMRLFGENDPVEG